MSAKFIPNMNIEQILTNKKSSAVDSGIHKFHEIEVKEQLIPMMSGALAKDEISSRDYGYNLGAKVGTKIYLSKNSIGNIEEIAPGIQRLFNDPRTRLHTSLEDHKSDIDIGGEKSFRKIHGNKPRVNKNAQKQWTFVVMNGPSFRNSILQEMKKGWLK